MRKREVQTSKNILAKISQKKEAKKRQSRLNRAGEKEYTFLISEGYVHLTHLQ